MSIASSTSTENISTRRSRIFYFLPYMGPDPRCIKVLDITDQIAGECNAKDFRRQAKQAAGCRSSPSPFCTLDRRGPQGRTFEVESPSTPGNIVTWKGGWTSAHSNSFTFPKTSWLGGYAVRLEAECLYRFRERFVLDNSTYTWSTDDPYSMEQFRLEKSIVGGSSEVGHYWKLHRFRQGGVLVLNTDEIDPLLGVVTCASVLRKRWQRIAEISN